MSHAYPFIVADTKAEVEAWTLQVKEQMLRFPGATIEYDTGPQHCTLLPIKPSERWPNNLWWPFPLGTDQLDAAYMLDEMHLTYDYSRLPKDAWQRGIVVSLS